jgi:threonine synthase
LHFEDNLTAERPTFVTHLECAYTGERHAADEVHNLSRAGKPLLVRYDLAGVAKALSKEALGRRAPTCGATVSYCRSAARRTLSALARP